MRKITTEELKEIIRKHELWLNNDSQGEEADLSRAYLGGANLREANLHGADLSGAFLGGADLSEADLNGADLSGANLYGTDLYRADLNEAYLYRVNLSGANLSGANLNEAFLRGANLHGAYLVGADLNGADLSGADLNWADLREANLNVANLRGANLSAADLSGANLSGAKIDFPMVCLEKGSFTGYKKCKNGLIVELEIPEDALRSSSTTRKCRCSKAKVISITNLDGSDSQVKEATSMRDSSFVYKIGETVEITDFDTNRWNECSTGIHFFMTRKEAVDYGI